MILLLLLFILSSFASVALAANPSADLDQCANGQAPSPNTDGCDIDNADWVNGNLGTSKAVYFEGDSIPYRMRFDNLSIASHTVTIEWDTTKSGKHALDYITTFNQTVANANPCLGVSGCSTFNTFAIPADPQVTGAGVTPVAGNFTLFGGTITGVSAYSYADGAGFAGDKSARITITFTASVANPVLAWGGHIATRADWGAGNSAVAIPGSPYHTRLIDLDGSGGNQDRSLSAEAVIFPASITIIKDAVPDDAQDFGFTSTGGLSPATFSLDDDSDPTLSNTQNYNGITTFMTYTVAETTVTGWALSFSSPPCVLTSPNGGGSSASGSTVTINMKEGENYTCTFTNTRQAAHLIVIKHVVNDNGGTAVASDFTMNVTGNSPSPASFPGAESPGTNVTLSPGSYSVSETGPSGYTESDSADCSGTIAAGQTKTCTITNDDQAAHLKLVKVVVNDNGGTAVATDWTLSAAGPTPLSGAGGAESDVNAGTYTLSESGPSGYSTTGYDCGASVTLALGESKTCTITNDDQTAHLTLVKVVVNDNGGTAIATDWTLSAAGPTPISGAGGVSSDVNAGTYTLSESAGPAGYTTTGYDCGASVTLALGEQKTCTITNDDQAATLTVIKHVINDNGGSATASQFTMTVAGTAVPGGTTSFPGAESPGTDVAVTPGSYSVSESGPSGYTESDGSDCTGTIALGEHKTCTITNDDIQQQVSQITPTNTTCSQFASGTAATLNQLQYSVKDGKINQVNPGVFFYWVKVTASPGSNTFTIDQAITTGNFDNHFFSQAAGSFAYTSDCSKINAGIISTSGSVTTVTFNASSAGTYIIGIKYDSGSVKDFNAPNPNTTVHYTFTLTGSPSSTQELDLVKKQ